MELPAHMNNITKDEIPFSNIICPECVLVKVDRNVFDIIGCRWVAVWDSVANDFLYAVV